MRLVCLGDLSKVEWNQNGLKGWGCQMSNLGVGAETERLSTKAPSINRILSLFSAFQRVCVRICAKKSKSCARKSVKFVELKFWHCEDYFIGVYIRYGLDWLQRDCSRWSI